MYEIKIGEYFDFKKGTNKFNKKIINNNPGSYPVYSGQTEAEGIIGKTNIYEYDGKYIRICTVGNAGKTDIIEGRFSLAQNNGILIPLDNKESKDIYLEYIVYKIQNILPALAKGDNTGNKQKSLLKPDILNTKISIPINKFGKFDLDSQIEIYNKYKKILDKKNELENKKKEIKAINVNFIGDIKMKYVSIQELFDINLGSGKYTKSFCIKNQGEYPVYSGNTISYFDKINEYMYCGEYLTWAKDGLAGYMMLNSGKFSITNHRGILILKDKKKNINLEYIKIVLEPIFRKNIKGRLGTDEKNEYTTLSKEMIKNIKEKIPIPINTKGEYDLDKQNEIASKVDEINRIKERILCKINEIIDVEVTL